MSEATHDAVKTSPLTMRAWTHPPTSAPSTLQLASLPIPKLASPAHVIIRVHYAALNPGGSIMMQLCPSFLRTTPCIPEMDFSGEVIELGADVPVTRGLEPGTLVFGSVPVAAHLKGSGALAEYVSISQEYVTPVPKEIAADKAAGLPIAGCTALSLLDRSKLVKGMKVLINGAGGGIGSFVTQMARNAIGPEGTLVAVASTEKGDMLKSLGVDEIVDHRTSIPSHTLLSQTFVGTDKQFDVIIDAYGSHSLFLCSPSYLKPTGSFVTVGIAFEAYTYSSMLVAIGRMLSNVLWPRGLGGTDREYAQVSSVCTLDGLERLAKLCDQQKLTVPVGDSFAFEDVHQAYEKMLSRKAKGKIVVKVKP